MKKYFLFTALLISLISLTQAQTAKTKPAAAVKTETFEVNGNCGMCKTTIEKAAKKAGASFAKWNIETHQLQVKYNTAKTNIPAIQKKIAESGYDNAGATASDAVYDKLHHCCKYERKGTAVTEEPAPAATAAEMKACCKEKLEKGEAACCMPETAKMHACCRKSIAAGKEACCKN